MPAAAASSRFAPHKPGTREISHLLQGRLEVHTVEETIPLHAGDTATVRVDSEHWFANPGASEARVILLVMGG